MKKVIEAEKTVKKIEKLSAQKIVKKLKVTRTKGVVTNTRSVGKKAKAKSKSKPKTRAKSKPKPAPR